MTEQLQIWWKQLDEGQREQCKTAAFMLAFCLPIGLFGIIENDRSLDELCGDDRHRCILVRDEQESCYYVCSRGNHWELDPEFAEERK